MIFISSLPILKSKKWTMLLRISNSSQAILSVESKRRGSDGRFRLNVRFFLPQPGKYQLRTFGNSVIRCAHKVSYGEISSLSVSSPNRFDASGNSLRETPSLCRAILSSNFVLLANFLHAQRLCPRSRYLL